MNATTLLPVPGAIVYPESDGKPMADNTKQLRWIFVLYGNLAALYREVADVFVGSNQFWYPEENHPEIVTAPDVYVVYGRPKGDRPSYLQWLENNVPMTVVFEILSPKNTYPEMAEKEVFFEDYGVEEYYVYDPDANYLQVFLRQGTVLRRVRSVKDFISPRMGIRFDFSGQEMVVYHPDGRPFLTFEDLTAEREREKKLRIEAEQQVARLAELSRKARRGLATPEELAELERLEEQAGPSAP